MMSPYLIKKPEGELLVTKAIRRLSGMLYDRKPRRKVAKPVPSTPDAFEKIYDAFEHAETSSRGFDHLRDSDQKYWRRTVAGGEEGSSAYGPVQMTKTLYRDMLENQEKYGLDKDDIPYVGLLAKQGEEFLKHGKNEGKIPDYNPEYDYSGRGFLANPGFAKNEKQWKKKYKDIAVKAMKEHYQRTGTVEGMVELWRGKKPQEDPDYYKRFYSKYDG